MPLVNFISVEDPRLRIKLVGYRDDRPRHHGDHRALRRPAAGAVRVLQVHLHRPGRRAGDADVADGLRQLLGHRRHDAVGRRRAEAPTKTSRSSTARRRPSRRRSARRAQHAGRRPHRADRPHRAARPAAAAAADAKVSLPPGLTGRLPAVPACESPRARANECPDASLVGSPRSPVGTGPGAAVAARQGVPDRGLRQRDRRPGRHRRHEAPGARPRHGRRDEKLVLRPDTGIDVVRRGAAPEAAGHPDRLPLDRPDDRHAPASCATRRRARAQPLHGAFSSVGGELTAAADAAYQATGCDKLPFAPKLSTKLGAPGEVAAKRKPPAARGHDHAGRRRGRDGRTVVSLPRASASTSRTSAASAPTRSSPRAACPASSKIGTVTRRHAAAAAALAAACT